MDTWTTPEYQSMKVLFNPSRDEQHSALTSFCSTLARLFRTQGEDDQAGSVEATPWEIKSILMINKPKTKQEVKQ